MWSELHHIAPASSISSPEAVPLKYKATGAASESLYPTKIESVAMMKSAPNPELAK